MKKHWKIIVLLLLIAGAVALTVQIVKASKETDDSDNSTNDGTPDLASKLLGSAATSVFAKDVKVYADSAALRVRATGSLTGTIKKTVEAGTLIGTTTGKETTADNLTWVEVTLPDSTLGYVAKNFTYILK